MSVAYLTNEGHAVDEPRVGAKPCEQQPERAQRSGQAHPHLARRVLGF